MMQKATFYHLMISSVTGSWPFELNAIKTSDNDQYEITWDTWKMQSIKPDNAHLIAHYIDEYFNINIIFFQ